MTDPIRVLHVEDDPDFAELVDLCLGREDARIEVTTACTADEGLERLSEAAVDCIVSDYDMPGRNGIEFLSAVREGSPDLPFILFTGKGSESVASEAISAGVSDYLQKSTDTEQFALLANRIKTLVAGYRAIRESQAQTARIRSIFERVSDAFIALDREWHFTEVNPRAEQLLRRPATNLIGRTVWEVFPELRGMEIEAALYGAMERGETPLVREHFAPLDVWMEVRPFPLEEGISVYFRDFTGRVERETARRRERHRLATLFDRLPDPVVEYDFEGDDPVIRAVNPAFEETFGVKAADAIGTALDAIVVPSGYEDEALMLNQRILVGDRLDRRVMRRTASGPRPFLLRNAPFPEADGVRGYSIYVDIEARGG